MVRRIAVSLLLASSLLASCAQERRAAPCLREPATTEAGLTIEDVVCGRGRVAEGSDVVDVRYSVEVPGEPRSEGSFRFVLGAGQVIQGWDDGIPGMRVGGTRRLRVPSELAFGESGLFGVVPPDATLVFEVTLLAVEDR